jgi:hypothetical protein
LSRSRSLRRRTRSRSAGFDLLRASSTWTAQVNRVQCGLDNQGNVCTDVFGSPTGGGGFWPGGTPNQYIFNSGLQIAGVVAPDAPIWAGDTVGAFFFDARGTQPQGQQVTLIYSSANPDDVEQWPNGAVVRDGDLYDQTLLGRSSISQEDTWVRYWDGPLLLSGRAHPMGILVEQRGLAWNYPSGNEDIIYFIYTFYNISASDPAAYADLDPAIRDEIAGLGADWVAATEDGQGVDIPPQGYTIEQVYAAFAMDPDVGNASVNASTAVLPFSMGVAYKTDFDEPTWFFPPEINGPPFGPYPGFVGVKYLKSPQDVGLTLFSNTTNSSQFPDPVGVSQLWRYLSGNITPSEGDPVCDINPPIERKLCALKQSPDDTRFYQASGPLVLEPGASATIVVAYVHAAPVGAVVAPFFGGTLEPGIPPSGEEILADPSLLREIELGTGWLGQNDDDASGSIEQDEVVTLDRSLLRKSITAQNLFDGGFLLPFAPEGPQFFLVPGDNSVTVVWQPSETEAIGDPYYNIASDAGNPGLFDANYRQFDVEGYRIYRGRTRAQLALVAQFDYAGTTFVDYTGAWAYSGRCAPELGILEDCPSFPDSHELIGDISQVPPGGRVELAGGNFREVVDAEIGTGDGTTAPELDNLSTVVVPTSVIVTAGDLTAVDNGAGALAGDGDGTIDYTTGAVAVTWSQAITDGTPVEASYSYVLPAGAGEVLITESSNPVEEADCGGGLNCPALSNTGVPFAFIDNAVANSTTYYYAVSAFDVNSIKSGPGSLESPLATQSVVPRAPAPNLSTATLTAGVYGRGELLDQSQGITFNGGTGQFTGSPPPTTILTVAYEVFAPTALQAGAVVELTIDSVQPSYYDGEYWMTLNVAGQTSQVYFTHTPQSSSDLGPGQGVYDPIPGSIPADPSLAAATGNAGLPFAGQAVFDFGIDPITFYSGDTEWHKDVDGAFWSSENLTGTGASRWFSGDDETTPYEDGVIWRGALDGVTTIQSPQPNWGGTVPGNPVYALFRRIRQATWHAARQADIKFYWGSTPGTLDSVIDVTHNIPLNFHSGLWYGVGWGFRDDITGIGTSTSPAEGVITEYDFTQGPCASPLDGGLPSHSTGGCETRPLLQAAVLQPVDIDGDNVADGNGFALYFNHEFYIFQADALPSSTVWTHRSYFGLVGGSAGAYTFATRRANATIPGLTARVMVEAPAAVQEITAENLENVHTVPDPYYVTNGLEVTPSQKILKFVNLPNQAIIRIYSVSGILVDIIEYNDPGLGGEATWDVRNRNNQFVASGVYFYHVETPSGAEKIGRFTVVNSKGIAVGTPTGQ